MPMIYGIGDELIYAALFSVPVILICFLLFRMRQSSGGRTHSENQGGYFASISSPPENEYCCICHDNFTVPCQANCAHWFCGACILRVWQHTAAFQPCKCPICRRPINLLMFSELVTSNRDSPERDRVIREVAEYNRVHGSGSVGFLQRMWDMPLLLRRMLQDLTDPQRALSLVHRMYIGIHLTVLVLYILSPLDLIPEGIFGIVGLLDDLAIMFLVLFHLATLYRNIIIQRY